MIVALLHEKLFGVLRRLCRNSTLSNPKVFFISKTYEIKQLFFLVRNFKCDRYVRKVRSCQVYFVRDVPGTREMINLKEH